MIKRFLCLCLCLGISASAFSEAHESQVWRDVPIRVTLSQGLERVLKFESPITLLRQEKIQGIDIIKAKQRLYLKPKARINQRLMIQLQNSGDIILVDLEIDQEGLERAPLDITSEKKATLSQLISDYDYNAIVLTRFAIQTLYSPERIVEKLPGVIRLNITQDNKVKIFKNSTISSKVMASWRAGKRYVTAIDCKNLSNKTIRLDKQVLYGRWQTASFYPRDRLPANNKQHTSTLILVSTTPFESSLNQSLRRHR